MASEASRNPCSGQSLSLLICGMGVTHAWKPAGEPEEEPTCYAGVFNTVCSFGHLPFPMLQGRVRARDPVARSHIGQVLGMAVFQLSCLPMR